MITATSTVKVSVLVLPMRDPIGSDTPRARLKLFWHPLCATEVGLVPSVRDSSWSDTPNARLKSV